MHTLFRGLKIAGVVLGFLILAGAILAADLYRFSHLPAEAEGQGEPVTLRIEKGQGFSVTAGELEKRGLVRSATRLRILARLTGTDTDIKAGQYRLSPSMPPIEILEHLVKGMELLYRVTIPEGSTMAQIAAIIEKEQFCPASSFLSAATDQALLAEYGVDAATAEGYLFPETYHFPRPADCRNVVRAMMARFADVFTPEYEERAGVLGLSVHEVVTLASIIEKETGDPTERATISSVFHNRLDKRMRLQSDPTVIYGLKDFDGNLIRHDLRTPTPYNTYTIRGLPPGPIANPGEAAIRAALYPEDTDYLFFVSKRNGSHHFSRNLREHNMAVRKYQLRRR
ncbi:MAG: endolytic transglycosylase MltG [Desulfatibacillaceae bacterium]